MRTIIYFSLIVIITFILGAILAYPLKLLLDPVFELAVRKYLNYATLISGIITCSVYLKINNLLTYESFGFGGETNKFLKRFIYGFLYGLLIMSIIETILFILKIHELDVHRSIWLFSNLSFIAKALITGLLIAFIEELIFRGAFLLSVQNNKSSTKFIPDIG